MGAILTKCKLALVIGTVLTVAALAIHVAGLKAERDRLAAELTALGREAAGLTEANLRLKTAAKACHLATAAQSAATMAALARREELNAIMVSPAPNLGAGPTPKGEVLNDTQDRKMVGYWNDLFAGLGLRGEQAGGGDPRGPALSPTVGPPDVAAQSR